MIDCDTIAISRVVEPQWTAQGSTLHNSCSIISVHLMLKFEPVFLITALNVPNQNEIHVFKIVVYNGANCKRVMVPTVNMYSAINCRSKLARCQR